jgi:hypothetical protein
LINSSGKYYLQFNSGFTSFNTPFFIQTNQWINIAVSYDGYNVYIWEDGQEAGSQSYTLNTISGGSFNVGSGAGGANPVQASLADFRIYNTDLSAAQLQTNFLAVNAASVEPPQLLYLSMLDDITATPEYSYDYWPAPLKDSSILNNTNVLYYSNQESPDPGAWVSGPNGVVNSALHFHGVGGSYADTGDSNDFAFTANSYTIALWVRPLTGGGTFLSCGVAGTNGWCVNEDVNYNLFFNTYTNGVTTSVGSIPVHNDAYHAILISVSNGTNVCMYRDGVAFATGAVNVPAPSGTNTLMLGRQNLGGSFGNTLDGNIWMPQIWSRNLSVANAVILYMNQENGASWPVVETTVLPPPTGLHIIFP